MLTRAMYMKIERQDITWYQHCCAGTAGVLIHQYQRFSHDHCHFVIYSTAIHYVMHIIIIISISITTSSSSSAATAYNAGGAEKPALGLCMPQGQDACHATYLTCTVSLSVRRNR